MNKKKEKNNEKIDNGIEVKNKEKIVKEKKEKKEMKEKKENKEKKEKNVINKIIKNNQINSYGESYTYFGKLIIK